MASLQRIVSNLEGAEALDRIAQPIARAVARAARPRAVKRALSGTWVGHPVHPMLTDLPIGSWVAAAALDLLGGRPAARPARRLVGLGVLAALPTAAAGLSDWSDTYGPDQRVGLVHAGGNVGAVLAQAGSYLARRRGRRGLGLALSRAGLGATLGSAYLGGHLSFVRGVGVNHTAFEARVEDWTDVAALAELAPDKPVRATATGVPVVLVRRGDDVTALSATCVQAGGPLDEGELVDSCIRCPWHGSIFRLSDGSVVRGPASTPQPALEVRVQDGRVQVRSAAG